MNEESNYLTGASRRSFLKKTAIGAAGVATLSSAKSYGAVIGANSKVRVAVIGLKRRGIPHLESLAAVKNVEVTYVCEVDGKQMKKGLATAKKALGYTPKAVTDMREIVEKKDVDAVMLAIPDHWHAYGTMIGAQNGKHVYVEKPCSHNLAEDDFLMDLEKKYKKLTFQVGVQQRSSPETIEVIKAIHGGAIGDVYKATTFYNNGRDRVPVPKVVTPPSYFDWELWQGPAPRREFLDIMEDYMWHWNWHWGTAEAANNGTHELDVARWALGVEYPTSVQTQGGKEHFKDDGWEMYDTMMASFKFPGGKLLQWDGKSRNKYETYGAGRGSIIYGTDGTVFVNRDGYKMYDRGGKMTSERTGDAEAGTALGGGGGMTTRHIRNFIESIRGNESPKAPISVGAVSTHLANYINAAAKSKRQRLMVDPKTGQLKDKEAMKMFWGRTYEPGWELTL